MKARKQLFAVILAFIGLVGYSQKIDTPYFYPTQPGTDEWRKFQSQDEMINACQIPTEILKNLSTSALVETCLMYPLYSQITAYNNMQHGFDNIASKFNGFSELLNRIDAGQALFKNYKTINPSSYSFDWTSVRKGMFVYEHLFIEMLLAQDKVLSNLNSITKKDLANESLKKYDGKLKESNLFGLVGLEHTTYLMLKILHSENDGGYKSLYSSDNKVKTFHDTAILADMETLTRIKNLVIDYSSRK